MTIDTFRSVFILVWIAGLVICCLIIGVELLLAEHLKFDHIEKLYENLSGCLFPSIALMITTYFTVNLHDVPLTKGQMRVSVILSSIYILAVLTVTVFILFISTDNIDQEKGNSYQLLLTAQPLLTGVLAYIFGKGQKTKKAS